MGSEVVFEPFPESPVDAWPQSQVGHYLRFNYTIGPCNVMGPSIMLSKLHKKWKLGNSHVLTKSFKTLFII